MLNVILAIVHPHSLLASMETPPVLLVPGDPRQVSAEVHLALLFSGAGGHDTLLQPSRDVSRLRAVDQECT